MSKVITYIKKRGGYVTLKELKKASFQTRDISKLIDSGEIEKIKPGLYRLPVRSFGSNVKATLIDVCRAIPGSVIALISALDYHQLTTFNPSEVYLAIPHASKPGKIIFPPVKTFFFRDRFYSLGIETVKTSDGTFRIYNKEKTICDMFRYRNKLGEDLAVEALKNYLSTKKKNLKLLQEYAVQCQVKTILLPYLRVLVG